MANRNSRTRGTPGAREQARAGRIAEQRAAALAAERRRKRLIGGAAAAALVAVIVAIAVVVIVSQGGTAVVAPPGATSGGGIVVGQASAQHTLVLYEDPQCPLCRELEKTSGTAIKAAIGSRMTKVEYRMLHLLGDESTRADNALACADQVAGIPAFEQLRENYFTNQPAQKSGGFQNSDLISRGKQVGITDAAFATCVDSGTYNAWVQQVGTQADRDNIPGIPTGILDGRTLDQTLLGDPSRLAATLGVTARAGTPSAATSGAGGP